MLRKLTNAKVVQTWGELSKSQIAQFRAKWLERCKSREDQMECPFEEFQRDLVSDVAYRDSAGRDGNWDEMEAEWKISESDYNLILNAMRIKGYDSSLEEW